LRTKPGPYETIRFGERERIRRGPWENLRGGPKLITIVITTKKKDLEERL